MLKKIKFLPLFLSLFIISCGKPQITIEQPQFGNNSPMQSNNNNSGNNTGSTGPDRDGAGGDIVNLNKDYLYVIFNDEDKLADWLSKSFHNFILSYELTLKTNPTITKFINNIDAKLNTDCGSKITAFNKKKRNHLMNQYDSAIELAKQSHIHLEPKFKTINELIQNQMQTAETLNNLKTSYYEDLKKLNCTNYAADFIKGIHFDIKHNQSCEIIHNSKKEHKSASFNIIDETPTLCISLPELTSKTIDPSLEHIFGILIHEIAHAFDYNEMNATLIQKYAVKNYDLFKIENSFDTLKMNPYRFVLMSKIFDLITNYSHTINYLNTKTIEPQDPLSNEIKNLLNYNSLFITESHENKKDKELIENENQIIQSSKLSEFDSSLLLGYLNFLNTFYYLEHGLNMDAGISTPLPSQPFGNNLKPTYSTLYAILSNLIYLDYFKDLDNMLNSNYLVNSIRITPEESDLTKKIIQSYEELNKKIHEKNQQQIELMNQKSINSFNEQQEQQLNSSQASQKSH